MRTINYKFIVFFLDTINIIIINKLSNVYLNRALTQSEILEELKKSKIICMTSFKEGLPTILIEGLFTSNALVSYDCNYGPSDIITEKNGFLIPLHDQKKQTLENTEMALYQIS